MNVVAQNPVRQSILSQHYGHRAQHRIVLEALIDEPGAIAARDQQRQEDNGQDREAAPQAAIGTARRWLRCRRHVTHETTGSGLAPSLKGEEWLRIAP